MIQTHRLTIIPIDGLVITDIVPETLISHLDFSQCGVPNNVHALQWNNPSWPDPQNTHLIGLQYGQGSGWIEFRSSEPNQEITELPEWAINCYNVWLEKYNGPNENNL